MFIANNKMLSRISGLSVRSLVVLVLVVGSCYLAIVDKEFRQSSFENIVMFGLGGYTGQLIPK